ncbi:MAG: hypothetical protein P8186_05050 [Anaerolineae bacterium]
MSDGIPGAVAAGPVGASAGVFAAGDPGSDGAAQALTTPQPTTRTKRIWLNHMADVFILEIPPPIRRRSGQNRSIYFMMIGKYTLLTFSR